MRHSSVLAVLIVAIALVPLTASATTSRSDARTAWDGISGLALVTMPNGTLRLFAAGATHAGSNAFGINTFTAPAGAGSWQLQNGVFWGGAVANSAAYIGATLT